MTSTPRIVRAEPGRAARVSALIAHAFVDLPPTRWLVADPVERERRLDAQFVILVEHALRHGHVEVTSDGAAAAVWFHNDGAEPPPPPDYDERLAAAAGPHLPRFRALDDAFAAHHPHEPHHHLAFLAVRPDRQRRGLGSLLLSRHHRRLDEAGIPAYLEASTTRSRDLYLRHGYELTGDPFHLPEDGPPFWPMWRVPGS
ncbi:MAG TPA: GNAT family N-acetyltransferase [Actinophytocola sp.]|uniref:GNAT family N-acetyltransferase n=1 Tax=Actinophytocola sp. TaxID=1872138 RepID=UPI002DDD988C|nr:GNAT family N-acetyltransferase [Actinophytocola sp.]HEV2783206.1 GNAT family N-acetyltransferase [Actinophytocola sp.]